MNIMFIFILMSVIQLMLMYFFIEKSDRNISVSDKLGLVGYQWYTWGKRIITIVILSVIILNFTEYYSEMTMNRIFLIVLILSMSCRAITEWKYIRETKRHKVTVSILILMVLFSIFIFFLKPL